MTARFFRSDAMVEKLGEVEDCLVESREFFQITYDHLREMEGKVVAEYDHQNDWWLCLENGTAYSDVVIHNPA